MNSTETSQLWDVYFRLSSYMFPFLILIRFVVFSYYMKQLTVPKIRLYASVFDIGLSSMMDSLCWPVFFYNIMIRYSMYIRHNFDERYILVPFLFNAEIYRATYRLSSQHLHIVPNLYSRRIIFRENNPLTVICLTLRLLDKFLQVIFKI